MKWYKSKILSRKFLTEDNYFLYLYKPDDFSFIPGQYIAVRKNVVRLYSIASLPEEPFIMLYIKRVKNGYMSNLLANLDVGNELEISQPMGEFTIDKSKNDKVVFIAMGSGISPIRPMIYYSLKQGKEVYLLYQEKTKNHLAFNEEFETLNINYIPILSRDKNCKYCGHVQNFIDKFIFQDADYFICGSKTFVNEITSILKQKGIKNIYFEKY